MNEQWRPVPGYERWYEVSDLGRIKILAYSTKRLRKGIMQDMFVSEHVADPSPQKDGYRRIELRNRDTNKIHTAKICSIVAVVFNNIDNQLFAHKNGDISDDRACNIVKCADLLDYSDAIWKGVPGFEDYYQVSDTGMIRNVKGRYPKQDESFDGYLTINLSYNGKYKSTTVHRLVAEAFLDTWDPNLEVNHKDGNKKNNCVDNLEMVTHQENMDHYWRSEVFAEQQAKYSEYAKKAMTDRWKDPEFRNKIQTVFDSPEYRRAHSEAGKEVWNRPGMREFASNRSKEVWSREGMHDKQVAAIKEGWSDPAKRKAASERMQGVTWLTAPDGTYYRCPPDELASKLAEGYVRGREDSNVGGKVKIHCAKNGKIYNSMTECEQDLGLKAGDVYHIVRNKLLKRLKSVQEDLQLFMVVSDSTN